MVQADDVNGCVTAADVAQWNRDLDALRQRLHHDVELMHRSDCSEAVAVVPGRALPVATLLSADEFDVFLAGLEAGLQAGADAAERDRRWQP